ncbi:DUF2807 domain-containing protein [Niastella caeni]|uniref:DUF2807 domain-containing protein n=1 Tax=Niastella caeni TaxID=2569763 RepID=A0A4S8I255_9BACT|nr:head GIN domain-containing protein [Niastella caeni]THU39872.1 DUF2807 domain-containing protein [Niastella caeni]
MKNFYLALCVVLLFVVSTSCEKVVGKGPVVTETRQTASFEGLEVEIPADIYFTEAPDAKIELHAQQNILDEIETPIINNTLQIRFRHSNTRIKSNDGISIYVSGPNVRSLTVDGDGYLQVPAPFTPSDLHLEVNGSGSIRANNVTTSRLNASIDGSGSINVNSGNANATNLNIRGSGLLDVSGAMAKDGIANIKGSGNIRLFATATLDARITGSGTISYKGSPAVTTHVTGSGTVIHF